MELAYTQAERAEADWRETLYVSFGLGLPGFFNLEWLMDKAECGEWGGLWW